MRARGACQGRGRRGRRRRGRRRVQSPWTRTSATNRWHRQRAARTRWPGWGRGRQRRGLQSRALGGGSSSWRTRRQRCSNRSGVGGRPHAGSGRGGGCGLGRWWGGGRGAGVAGRALGHLPGGEVRASAAQVTRRGVGRCARSGVHDPVRHGFKLLGAWQLPCRHVVARPRRRAAIGPQPEQIIFRGVGGRQQEQQSRAQGLAVSGMQFGLRVWVLSARRKLQNQGPFVAFFETLERGLVHIAGTCRSGAEGQDIGRGQRERG